MPNFNGASAEFTVQKVDNGFVLRFERDWAPGEKPKPIDENGNPSYVPDTTRGFIIVLTLKELLSRIEAICKATP